MFGREDIPTFLLERTRTGWCLVDRDDRIVFSATGPNARRACLARAMALGALRVGEGERPRADGRAPAAAA